MNIFTWNNFETKNERYEDFFEDLSFKLFLKKNKSQNALRFANHPGIECMPVLNPDTAKYHGYQAKYIKEGNGYGQIKDSLKKTIELKKAGKYKNLNVFEVYSNKKFSFSSVQKTKIEQLAKKNRLEIEWINGSYILEEVQRIDNSHLASQYFGLGDEVGFVGSNFHFIPEIISLFDSKSFLPFEFTNNAKTNLLLSNLKSVIKKSNSDKLTLITGAPGSGKSVVMAYITAHFAGHDTKKDKVKEMWGKFGLPFLINLKEYSTKNLRDLIRERTRDFDIPKNKMKFIYILDGLDEVAANKLADLIAELKSLFNERSTSRIIISSRESTNNIIMLKNSVIKINSLKINQLTEKKIDEYFEIKTPNKKKYLDKLKRTNPEIIIELKEIILLELFWLNIEKFNQDTDVFDLYQIYLDHMLSTPMHSRNLSRLGLLNNKKERIIQLNEQISLLMQKEYKLQVTENEVQELLMQIYPRLLYEDVNEILEYIFNCFFQDAGNKTYQYRHRRFQEYFLLLILKHLFEKDKQILRKLRITSDKNYLVNFFLKYLSKVYKEGRDLAKKASINTLLHYAQDYYQIDYDVRQLIHLAKLNPELENIIIQEDFLSLNFTTIAALLEYGFIKEARKNFKDTKEFYKDDEKGFIELINDNFKAYVFVIMYFNKQKWLEIFEKVIRGNYEKQDKSKNNFQSSEEEKLLQSYLYALFRLLPNKLLEFFKELKEEEILIFFKTICQIEYLPLLFKDRRLKQLVKQYLETHLLNSGDIYVQFLNKLLGNKVKIKAIGKIHTQLMEDMRNDFSFKENMQDIAITRFLLGGEFIKKYELQEKANDQDLEFLFPIDAYVFLIFTFIEVLDKRNAVNLFDVFSKFERIIESRYYHHERSRVKYEVSQLWAYIFVYSSNYGLKYLKGKLINNEEVSSYTFLKELLNLDQLAYKNLISKKDIDEISAKENLNLEFMDVTSNKILLAQLFAPFSKSNSNENFWTALNYSSLRHGYHKDIIVSYGLIDAFENILKSNILNEDEVIQVSERIMKLVERIEVITDGSEVGNSARDFIKALNSYDVKISEQFIERLSTHQYAYNQILAEILSKKAELGYPFGKIIKKMDSLNVRYDRENELTPDYLALTFKIYLSLANNKAYKKEQRVDAFEKAQEIIRRVKERNTYGFDYYYKEELKQIYKRLCHELKSEIIEVKSDSSEYKPGKDRITEKTFLELIVKAKNKKDFIGLINLTENYQKYPKIDNPNTFLRLAKKCYEIYGNLKPFLDFVFNRQGVVSNVWNVGYTQIVVKTLPRLMSQSKYRVEIEDYILQYAEHYGIKRMIDIYLELGEEEKAKDIFYEFLDLCEFLLL